MHVKKYKLILFLSDLACIASIVAIAYLIRYYSLYKYDKWYIVSNLKPLILIPFVILVVSILILFRNSSLYRLHVLSDSYYQFVVFVKSILIGYAILITSLFFMKHPLLEQRRIILTSFILLFISLPIYRIFLMKYVFRYALKNKIIGEKVILIGAGEKGQEIARELISNEYAYFSPIGFLDNNKQAGDSFYNIKVLDKINNIDLYKGEFDEILIALTNISYNKLQRIIRVCQRLGKPIHIISDLYRIIPEKVEVEKFDGFRTFQIPSSTGLKEYPYAIFKKVLDYTVAVLLILLLLPVWIVIAVLIKKESSGPVFFRADGIGYKEKPFVWYKFRTMYHNSDDSIHKKLIEDIASGVKEDGSKLREDPRITPTGRWLRKYSIDEFPQLINVLKGEMSLVGPRPVLPYEYEILDEWQKEILTILPGMTGLWQVRGRNEVNFEDQYVLDLYYVRNRSAWLDIEILFSTVSVVLSGKSGL